MWMDSEQEIVAGYRRITTRGKVKVVVGIIVLALLGNFVWQFFQMKSLIQQNQPYIDFLKPAVDAHLKAQKQAQ